MSGSPIRFHLDYVSSNATWRGPSCPRWRQRHGRAIEPVPVLFAELLEAHGQLGPAEVRPKARWMARNNLRKAALLGVPLRPPPFHPFNPLLALRISSLAVAPDARAPDRRAASTASGPRAGTWRSRGCRPVANEAGLDGPALVAAAQAPETKAAPAPADAGGDRGRRLRRPDRVRRRRALLRLRRLPVPRALPRRARSARACDARVWCGPTRPGAMRAPHRERPPLRLAHVNLPARDPRALAKWYADTFASKRAAPSWWGPGR